MCKAIPCFVGFISFWPRGKKTSENEHTQFLSNGAIFNNLERPLPPISRSCDYLMLNISPETLRDIQFQWNSNMDLHTTYSSVSLSFRMTLSDLAKYSTTQSACGLFATAELLVLIMSFISRLGTMPFVFMILLHIRPIASEGQGTIPPKLKLCPPPLNCVNGGFQDTRLIGC